MAATKIELPFKTAFNTQTKTAKATPSGEKIVFEHREDIDSTGRRKLIKDREINIYELIQASAESVEIETILRRAAEGDFSALNVVNGQYIDVVGAPATLAEAQKFVIKAKAEFDELPKEIRAKFENNAEIFVATYGTKDWQDKTGITTKIEEHKAEIESQKIAEENMKKAFENIAAKGALTNE